jgi:hypothetical protein
MNIMQKNESERLRYRRQYILSPRPIDCNFLNSAYSLKDNITLYAHVDLKVTMAASSDIRLVLLGDLFDYEYPEKDNEELLYDMIHADFSVFLEKISKYAGRFVIIYISSQKVYLLTDAAASRKVYYCRQNEGVYCASQPHLLASTLTLQYTRNPSKLSFYDSFDFTRLNNSNIGNTTMYDEIFQLIPNHYLDYSDNTSTRFWPFQKINILPLDEVVDKCAKMLKGYITGFSNRYKLMLPVTGGKDSRLLLSATYDIRNDLFYYINKEEQMSDTSHDITIPSSLLPKLNLDFHILKPYIEIDEEFRKIYFANNPYGNEKYLPIIYNYYKNFSDRINLPGIFVNIAEDVYEVYGKKISPQVLAELIQVETYDYAEPYYSEWLKGCQELCEKCNINVLNLLYWEERIANWGTQIQLDKDIAQEDIIPYNSRLLIETMLSADLKYREKHDFIIFCRMTRKLWPETLQAPCNPEFKADFLKFTKAIGIMKIIKYIYYRFIYRIAYMKRKDSLYK